MNKQSGLFDDSVADIEGASLDKQGEESCVDSFLSNFDQRDDRLPDTPLFQGEYMNGKIDASADHESEVSLKDGLIDSVDDHPEKKGASENENQAIEEHQTTKDVSEIEKRAIDNIIDFEENKNTSESEKQMIDNADNFQGKKDVSESEKQVTNLQETKNVSEIENQVTGDLQEKKVISEIENQVTRDHPEKKVLSEIENQVTGDLQEKKVMSESENQVTEDPQEKKFISESENQTIDDIQKKKDISEIESQGIDNTDDLQQEKVISENEVGPPPSYKMVMKLSNEPEIQPGFTPVENMVIDDELLEELDEINFEGLELDSMLPVAPVNDAKFAYDASPPDTDNSEGEECNDIPSSVSKQEMQDDQPLGDTTFDGLEAGLSKGFDGQSGDTSDPILDSDLDDRSNSDHALDLNQAQTTEPTLNDNLNEDEAELNEIIDSACAEGDRILKTSADISKQDSRGASLQLWLQLVNDRFQGSASLSTEPLIEKEIISSKTPLKQICNLGSSDLNELANPTFVEGTSTESRLRNMRRRAEDIAVASEHRQRLLQTSQETKEFAIDLGNALSISRSGDSEVSEDSVINEVVMAMTKLSSWDPYFEIHGFDGVRMFPTDDPACIADEVFSQVIRKQSQGPKRAVNGELIRQYLNVVLRGLPASPALMSMVKRIPHQDPGLCFAGNPDCKYALGKVTLNFRRTFSRVLEPLLCSSEPSSVLLKMAIKDLNEFIAGLCRCILWRYPYLYGCTVRDVYGDPTRGRMQDSRRGGDIPKSTEDAMLVIRTCVEDAVIDPLLDSLYLGYAANYGSIDAAICSKCMSITDSMSDKDIMSLVNVASFFQLSISNPHRKLGLNEESNNNNPYSAVIEILGDAWSVARTPASKVVLLGNALSLIGETIAKHYSRSTYWKNGKTGTAFLQSPITDKSTLTPTDNEMVSIFMYCVVKSMPYNLETQTRLLFDLASRHSVSHSDETGKAVALMSMCPRLITQLDMSRNC